MLLMMFSYRKTPRNISVALVAMLRSLMNRPSGRPEDVLASFLRTFAEGQLPRIQRNVPRERETRKIVNRTAIFDDESRGIDKRVRSKVLKVKRRLIKSNVRPSFA